MRDVFVTTEEIDNPEIYVKDMIKGTIEAFYVSETSDGCIIDLTVDGLRQRFSFSED